MTITPAPIVVSVYNRLGHLQQCVESLKANPLSQASDLFIVSDAAKSSDTNTQIARVREYIYQIEGFRAVFPLIRQRNLGSFQSVTQAIEEVIGAYGKLIFLEDDNIVAPNFLDFLNDALGFYRDDPSIFSVSAYNYPIVLPSSYPLDVYKWQGFSAWGVGLWGDRWRGIKWNYDGFSEMTRDKRREMDKVAEHLHRYIAYDLRRGRLIVDTVISYWLFTRGQYSVFPVISKVRNTGGDGSGEHSGVTDRYLSQPIDSGMPYRLVPNLQSDEQINAVLRRHFRTPLRAKLLEKSAAYLPQRQKLWLKRWLFR